MSLLSPTEISRSSNKVLKIIFAVAAVSVVVYLTLNATAIYKSIQFSLDPESQKDKTLAEVSANIKPGEIISPTIGQEVQAQVPNNWLSYPRFGIKAPIYWNVPAESATGKLASGLVHIASTSMPGEGGESLISGHSSYYWWQKGDYKEIFVNLPKAGNGDKIIVRRDKTYIYSVINKYQVGGGEGLVLETAGEEKLNLMTCVPLGTSLRRLIVEADLETSF